MDRMRLMIISLSCCLPINAQDYTSCPPGFVQYDNSSTCIGVTSTSVTPDNGENECKYMIGLFPGKVTMLLSRDLILNDWIVTSPLNLGKLGFWMGLNDTAVEGDYIWSDGVRVAFHKWKLGEPSDDETNQRKCVIMRDNFWEDRDCTDSKNVFCQYEMVTETDICPAYYSRLSTTSLCFAWFGESSSFDGGRQICKGKTVNKPGTSDLAFVHNLTIWSFITGLYDKNEGWIGLRDDEAFVYKWLTNKTLEWPLWMTRLRSLSSSSDDCIEWKEGAWDDSGPVQMQNKSYVNTPCLMICLSTNLTKKFLRIAPPQITLQNILDL